MWCESKVAAVTAAGLNDGTVPPVQGAANGHGGHNGLRDIIAAGGNDAGFLRLRIGIGHPGDSKRVVDYVLHKPLAEERVEIDAAIEDALEVVPLLQAGDLQQAQQQLHSR